jgi:catechol 2,3-dioxygenase-like lactoylglutathione lyase family enzyme
MTDGRAQAMALKRVARNVTDLARAEDFYGNVLGFHRVGPAGEDPELAALLKIQGVRILRLRSGDREIELSQCFPAAAPYQYEDANFVDFQHVALLTADIHAAYANVLANGAMAISDSGPVQLPAASGGVTAVKFRDLDGHPLEFLLKPGPGYDHSAISVANVNRSVAFYAGLGVLLDARQRNHGAEQDALDGLAGAELDVVALRPPQPSPHVELLCYHRPRAIPCQWSPADICADRLVFASNAAGLRLLRDPDGHVVVLDGR